MNKNLVTVEAVHTHTHTHTEHSLNNKKEISACKIASASFRYINFKKANFM